MHLKYVSFITSNPYSKKYQEIQTSKKKKKKAKAKPNRLILPPRDALYMYGEPLYFKHQNPCPLRIYKSAFFPLNLL
jgi:hypothetical protein